MIFREKLKTFGTKNMMFSIRSVGADVKELFEREVVSTVMYGAETLGVRKEKRRKFDGMGVNFLWRK